MKRILLCILALILLCATAPNLQSQQSKEQASDTATPSMPSREEVDDLLNKASEYIATYQTTFKNAKPTLDKAPTPGFLEKSTELCSQANTIIAAIKKNGMTAYALVALVGVLDDMSLNAARASAVSVVVGLQGGAADPTHRAAQDMQDFAQVEKNCFDISELILHSALRLIAVEEAILRSATDEKK